MSQLSPLLGFNKVIAGQAQAEVPINEATAFLEIMSVGRILSRTLTAPPGGESDGDAYVPAATATGDWATHENKIALYNGGWQFIAPQAGMRLFDTATKLTWIYTGTTWILDGRQLLTEQRTEASNTATSSGTAAFTYTLPGGLLNGRNLIVQCFVSTSGSAPVSLRCEYNSVLMTGATFSSNTRTANMVEWQIKGTAAAAQRASGWSVQNNPIMVTSTHTVDSAVDQSLVVELYGASGTHTLHNTAVYIEEALNKT